MLSTLLCTAALASLLTPTSSSASVSAASATVSALLSRSALRRRRRYPAHGDGDPAVDAGAQPTTPGDMALDVVNCLTQVSGREQY